MNFRGIKVSFESIVSGEIWSLFGKCSLEFNPLNRIWTRDTIKSLYLTNIDIVFGIISISLLGVPECSPSIITVAPAFGFDLSQARPGIRERCNS